MKRVIAIAALLFATVSASGNLPFVEDDYAKAAARASKMNIPLFVEAWAPW